MHITFHGAAGEVTGSCTLLETSGTRILIDCGMFQGSREAGSKNSAPFPFDPRSIDAMVVTHAHIDHVGRIPKLVKDGFDGRIFSTHPTRLLSRHMWRDAAKVMKEDARRTKNAPIYGNEEVNRAFDRMHGVDYGVRVKIAGGVEVVFHECGHIFGSSFVEMRAEGKTLVASGDVGNDNVPILRETADLAACDAMIMESTYGDRAHEDSGERSLALKDAVIETVRRRGVLLVPAFSLERTQEILYELNGFMESGEIPQVPIFLDSPLAIKVLPVYRQFPQYYDTEAEQLRKAGDDFFRFPGLRVVKKHKESLAIAKEDPPKVIIAGSGMMHGGRILGHLTHYLEDPRNMVLVVGYQAKGTLGRKVLEGASRVEIDREEVEVKAEVRAIGAYSAHADRNKLLRWLESAPRMPSKVFLNHGEPEASGSLAEAIRLAYPETDVVVAAPGVRYEL